MQNTGQGYQQAACGRTQSVSFINFTPASKKRRKRSPLMNAHLVQMQDTVDLLHSHTRRESEASCQPCGPRATAETCGGFVRCLLRFSSLLMNPLSASLATGTSSIRSAPKVAAASSEQRVDYAKVIKLFVSAHTAELQDRQMAAVRRVVRLNADG